MRRIITLLEREKRSIRGKGRGREMKIRVDSKKDKNLNERCGTPLNSKVAITMLSSILNLSHAFSSDRDRNPKNSLISQIMNLFPNFRYIDGRKKLFFQLPRTLPNVFTSFSNSSSSFAHAFPPK